MKHSLWTLTLAVFIAYSKAGVDVLVPPPNLQCACLNDRLRFTCTIVDDNGIGATWWSGTAFASCDGGRIQLRHSNPNAVGECDSGTISATSLGFEGNCITTELNIVVDSGLNNKTVQCVFASNSGMPTIDVATISLTTGPYEQAPSDVTLSNISLDEVIFSWSQIDPNCSTVQYQITNPDCGNCSLSGNRSATCSDLQLSTTERDCTFSVASVICGFTGPSSNPITVTLKVPDPPQVNLIPVYSSESQSLTSLNIVISSQTDSFVIYEGISGSIMNYTIYFSSGTNSSTISANCTDDGCESMFKVRNLTVCQQPSSQDSTVSVSAVNRLGAGPPSQPVTLECTNRFVTVNVDLAASMLTCQFQNAQNTNRKTCSVEYRVCGQEQVLIVKGNNTSESPDRVTLQLSLSNGVNCYAYTVTASDGTSTAMVKGKVDPPGETGNDSSVNVVAVVVPVVMILIVVVAIVVVVAVLIIVWRLQSRRKKYDATYATPESPESKRKIELISGTNQTYEPEDTDIGDYEHDLHRGDAVEEQEEQNNTVSESEDSDSLDEGGGSDEEGLESSDDNVASPESNSEQLGSDNEVDNDSDGGNVAWGFRIW